MLAQHNYEVHFLTKEIYSELLLANPLVYRVWTIKGGLDEVLPSLQKIDFIRVLDLHDNLRSLKVRKSLRVPNSVFDKRKISNFLWTKFNLKPSSSNSIMERFLKTTEGLCSSPASVSPSFTIPQAAKDSIARLDLPKDYYCIAVGAAWETKQIPRAKIQEVLDGLHPDNVILLGGPNEVHLAKELTLGPKVINLIGQLTITESGAVIEKAKALLSGDTGVMHIAAALGTSIVAVFGSTHPEMGYAPYCADNQKLPVIIQHPTLKCRPCTKHGKSSCPKGHFKCMEELEMSDVLRALISFN